MDTYFGDVTENTLKGMSSSEIGDLYVDLYAKQKEELKLWQKEFHSLDDKEKSLESIYIEEVEKALRAANVDVNSIGISASVRYSSNYVSIHNKLYKIYISSSNGNPEIRFELLSSIECITPDIVRSLESLVCILDTMYSIDWNKIDELPKIDKEEKQRILYSEPPKVNYKLFNKAYKNAKKEEDFREDIDFVADKLKSIIGTDAVIQCKDDSDGFNVYCRIISETSTHYTVKEIELRSWYYSTKDELFEKASPHKVRKDLFIKKVMQKYRDDSRYIRIEPDPDSSTGSYSIDLPKRNYKNLDIYNLLKR